MNGTTGVHAVAAAAPAGSAAAYLELTRPRVTSLVVATTAFGFHLGAGRQTDPAALALTLLGTTLVAAGTSALNMHAERENDARMERTRRRPLPEGRLRPAQALAFGSGLSALGVLILALLVGLPAALVAAVTLATYTFIYTPLKRVSPLATLAGAVPGALPPLIGWAAATGRLEAGAWALGAILFMWQLPHALAIAWMYREDYARGGFRLLPAVDPEGGATARQIVLNALLLVPVSLAPALLGMAGWIYACGAVTLGALLLWPCLTMLGRRGRAEARRIVLVSVLYLPALLLLMALDRP